MEETLKHVCKKILLDRSVSSVVRNRRARMLLLLGEVYVARRVADRTGIADFLDRLGKQSGLFGNNNNSDSNDSNRSGGAADGVFSPFTSYTGDDDDEEEEKEEIDGGDMKKKEKSSGGKRSTKLDRSTLQSMLDRVENTMTVRELKEGIVLLGGDPTPESGCLEKGDLKQKLNELILMRLHSHASDIDEN